MPLIESTRNETVKRARQLATRKGRLEQGLHFIEGDRLVREAVISGAEIHEAFIEEGHELMAAVLEGAGARVYTLKRSVMETLTLTETPQWVCATVKTPSVPVPEYYPEGLIVALDAVQDPGNLGTILRTAEAFALGAVVLCEGCADPFSPKVVRSTMGAVFRLPCVQLPLTDALARLKTAGLPVYATALHEDSVPLSSVSLGRAAVIIGSEGRGVSESALRLSDRRVIIPMHGRAESLNAGVAAAIVIYEMTK